MKREFLTAGALLVICALASGCVQLGAGASASSLPITENDSYTELGEAHSTSSALGFFGLQLYPTSAYDALQAAKSKYGADGLINVTADNKMYYLVPVYPIFTWHSMHVSGTAIKFERGGSLRR